MSITRRLISSGLVSLCVLCGVVALTNAPASAAVTHEYLSQESPEAYKPTNEVGPVAVDDSTSLTDWARGDTYEAVPSEHVVNVYEPEAGGGRKLVAQLAGPSASEAFTSPRTVAVNDTDGEVIVGDAGTEALYVFEPTLPDQYAFVRKLVSPEPENGFVAGIFAIDQSNGEIYAAEGPGFATAVAQFSVSGEYLGRLIGDTTPGGDFRAIYSVTVDPSSDDLYVLDHRYEGVPRGEEPQPSVVDIFSPDLVIPDVTTGAVFNLTPTGATLTGTVNADKAGEATCQFEWGGTTAFGRAVPCSAPVAEGASPVPVQASLSGLETDTTYCYRLQASNTHGVNPGSPSQNQCFTTPGPGMHAESISTVTSESVTFGATINPHNASTTYYFQYGTTSGYGADVPAAPGALVGSGEGDVELSQHVRGLEADTVYHYRVVALSELEGRLQEFDGPDQTFITQISGSALGLPDGRMYELVTPAAKEGALIFGPNWGWVENTAKPLTGQASADGRAIVDLASRPTEAEPLGNAIEVSVLSTRGSGGWSSQVIAPPHDEATFVSIGNGGEYRFFSEDLTQGIVNPFGNFTPLGPGATESTPYLRTDYLDGDPEEHCHSSCFQPLVTAANTPTRAVFGEALANGACPHIICGPSFVDATPDLSHVILSSPAQLTSVPTPEGGLYEWSGDRLQLISAPPQGEVGTLGLAGTKPTSGEYDARHALSNDGQRVILTGNGLYLRDIATDELVRLDVPQGGSAASESPVYMTASTDASRIFFLDNAGLTRESSASGTDLYEYDLNAPSGSRLTDLTVDEHAGEPAGVTNVIGASNDGSYVYFVAAGALTSDAIYSECVGHGSGSSLPENRESCNVYVRYGGVTRLVTGNWNAAYSGEESVRVSPDGGWLAFMSSRNLTGYDMHDAISGRPDQEVYLYDASTARLTCASCNPTGARPVGVEASRDPNHLTAGSLPPTVWAASNVPPLTDYNGLGESRYQPRYLSDTGRLFFDSNDALVPQDVNGTEDVYEYEPAGIGTCNMSSVTFGVRSNGCVSLISSGASAEESAFVDASEAGGDAFFITSSKMVLQDFDNAPDVYDAHECSVSVQCYPVPPAVPPVCSTGDACKAAPSPQPAIFGPAPSATFTGAGNVIPSNARSGVKSKSLTRRQKLARALRVCRRKARGQRAACKRVARKRFGPAGKSTASAKRKGRG